MSASERGGYSQCQEKGENIYKRKDGRWEGRYIRSYDSEHKAKYAYVYGKTYSEVKRKLTEQRGNVQKVQPTKNKSSTYGELLDCWLHSMQLNTKESTQARYTHLIKTHIKPHLGVVQLSQLTTDAIEIFIEQQLTDGRLDNSGGLSPKTVTDILTIIKSTIEYARYKELPVICNLSKLSIKKERERNEGFYPVRARILDRNAHKRYGWAFKVWGYSCLYIQGYVLVSCVLCNGKILIWHTAN